MLKPFPNLLVLGVMVCMMPCLMGQEHTNALVRTLSLYKTLGPLTLGHTPKQRKDLEKNKSAIRQFVWESFKSHNLAHVSFTSYSMEGNGIDNAIFIEPDENGTWHVHVESSSEYQSYGASRETIRNSNQYDAFSLLRIVDRGYGTEPRILSDNDYVSPVDYELRLLDKEGKRLTEI
jgi:hypothetical protein